MKDWVIRTIKTFIQAFFGVLIPAVCTMLSGGWPESWNAAWVILAPTVAAALSAAICAVWNIILEGLQAPQPAPAAIYGDEITDPAEEPAQEPQQGKHEIPEDRPSQWFEQ